MRLDESEIDLHGWLRAFYSCQALGRSFVMDYNVQRPLPSYANFSYGRSDYAAVLKEVLSPLGLRLAQGKRVDAIVAIPPKEPSPPSAPPARFTRASGEREGGLDSALSADSPAPSPPMEPENAAPPSPQAPRRLRAEASGLLRGSAKRLGVSWTEALASASPSASFSYPHLFSPSSSARAKFNGNIKTSHLWQISALASDSLGSLDFARIVDFTGGDTSRVVFGGETRRPEATINYEAGTALTQYASVFDGLQVDVRGDRWSFTWRGSGSVLEVPGVVGGCASGSSKVAVAGRSGLPLLGRIPALGRLFSWEADYEDELLVSVCLAEVPDA